jgi:hypothetical protein
MFQCASCGPEEVGQQENVTTPTHRNISDAKKERMGGGWVEKMQPGCLARKWGKGRKQDIFLASPRYLMGERTDQRSLSTLGERKTFTGRIIRISLTKPPLKHG